jgi:hypothetical protein
LGLKAVAQLERRLAVFTYLDFSKVLGGATAACARLPDQPAVYAFFRNIRVPNKDAPAEEFIEAIKAAVTARAAPDRTSKVGPLHSVRLECWSDLAEPKSGNLEKMAQDPAFRGFLRNIIETASLLQSPLYVGKADRLQDRIRQHMEPMSKLAVRLREANITINGCTLAYAIVDQCPVPLNLQTMTLIEEIISRLCRPGFVYRIG